MSWLLRNLPIPNSFKEKIMSKTEVIMTTIIPKIKNFLNISLEHARKLKEQSLNQHVGFYYLLIFLISIFVAFELFKYELNKMPPKTLIQEEHYKRLVDQQQLSYSLPYTTTTPPPSLPYNYKALPSCDLTEPRTTHVHSPQRIVEEFFKCASMILLRFSQNPQGMLFNWVLTTYVCDEEDLISKIPLTPFFNGEKTFWALLPTCKERNTLLTLGTTRHLNAQETLKTLIENLEIYGTDPFGRHDHLYTKFYQIALSIDDNKLEMSNSNIEFNSEKEYVNAINQTVFFNETLSLKKIDMLWINLNAGLFQYERFLNRGGQFEQLGIVVCQVNIEITKNESTKWFSLMWPLVHQKRFIFMRSTETAGGELIRVFLLNVVDSECTRKYLE